MRKTTLSIVCLLVALAPAAWADFSATFNSGFANGGAIPDGSFIGMQDTRTLTGVPFNTIRDVNVRVNVSGGWNGDLYLYLTHNSGFTVLLNRVGRATGNSFGYSDAGFNVTFNDQDTKVKDFHFYQQEPGFVASMLQGGRDGGQMDGTLIRLRRLRHSARRCRRRC